LYQLNQPRKFSSFFNPVRFTSIQLSSSHPFSLLGAASPLADIIKQSHRVTLPSHWVKINLLPPFHLFGNALSCCLPSWVETEALYLHDWRRLTSLNCLTPTLHCYKKIISTLITLPTTQSRLHFTSFLARALHHRSSFCCHHFLSPLSHTHRPSAQ
jgi:hypothetical protein